MAEHEPTRGELKAKLEERDQQLADLMRRIEALESAPKLTSAEQGRLAAAEAELASLKPSVNLRPVSGAPPQLIPYKGLVQATTDCHIGGAFRAGPNSTVMHNRYADVFEVDMPALWTDDPFVPVVVVGHREDGSPIVEPNKAAPPQIDFRFRPRGLDAIALQESTVRTAAQY